MLIDSKYKEHDGRVFWNFKDAREYAVECMNDKYCDKVAIDMFALKMNEREMMIAMVETMGFAGDKKDINQLELFGK